MIVFNIFSLPINDYTLPRETQIFKKGQEIINILMNDYIQFNMFTK